MGMLRTVEIFLNEVESRENVKAASMQHLQPITLPPCLGNPLDRRCTYLEQHFLLSKGPIGARF